MAPSGGRATVRGVPWSGVPQARQIERSGEFACPCGQTRPDRATAPVGGWPTPEAEDAKGTAGSPDDGAPAGRPGAPAGRPGGPDGGEGGPDGGAGGPEGATGCGAFA